MCLKISNTNYLEKKSLTAILKIPVKDSLNLTLENYQQVFHKHRNVILAPTLSPGIRDTCKYMFSRLWPSLKSLILLHILAVQEYL